ncbi:DNA polymerase beta superfamily protein [Acetobacter sp.]|uniref:DNA polymerase beta superfamily protein n=1 Tax=Acetobacter sp. TaxID=440 RepID=UPI0039E8FD81
MNVTNEVDPVIQDIVERALEEIEASLGARIIFAVDAGPRGSGTASADSPYQIRFVYVHRLDWYLKLTPGADSIDLPASDDFSLSGWDIRRLLKTIQTGDFAETGWLTSRAVYRSDADLLSRLVGLQRRAWRPAEEFRTRVEKARREASSWGLGVTLTTDQFLEAFRPAAEAHWIAEGKGPLPYDLQMLCADLNPEVKNEVSQLLDYKKAHAASEPAPITSRSQLFMDNELPRLRNVQIPTGVPASEAPFDRVAADLIRRFG